MASQLINLNQLRTTVINIKTYADKAYAELEHNHDDKYASFDYVDSALLTLEDKLEDKAIKDHAHKSSDVMTMDGYVIADELSEIASGDSLNVAIGKLEYAVNNAAEKDHNHNGVYLGKNETAAAAKQLEESVEIGLSGDVLGSASFNGSSDITISTTMTNISSEKISSMTGYSKPESTSAISDKDTLNSAIGKLEAALDLKQDAGDIDVNEFKDYVDTQVSELIGGEDIPDSLNTLRELASAINDDPTFAETINTELLNKSDKEHTHDLVTETTHGFMSFDDKVKLNGVENEANNYIHPATSGNKHIPEGGELGQVLVWADDGTAQWSVFTSSSATDSEVNNMLDSIFPLNKEDEEDNNEIN